VIKNTKILLITLVILFTISIFWIFNADTTPEFKSIPHGLTVAIDDLGWQGGSDLSSIGGPYRIGTRDMVLDDYQDIVQVGKNMGVRIHTNWILSELDRSNICAKPEYNLPIGPSDITEFALNWDNSQYVDDDNFVLMDYVKDNAAWMEFGLHGVRHEHWINGIPSRAEWATSIHGAWGWEDMDMHTRCFLELLRQYYTEEECSFPVGFVPPALKYYHNADDNHTTGALLHSYGVKYAHSKYEHGIDNGVLVLKRVLTEPQLITYKELATIPNGYPSDNSVNIGTHPANWYDYYNEWELYLRGINNNPNRYYPKNEIQSHSQWLFREYALIISSPGKTIIDNTKMVDNAYSYDLLGSLVLKTQLNGQHVSSASVDNGAQIVGYYEDEFGYGYIIIGHKTNTMGRLSNEIYTLTYTIGDEKMPIYIDMSRSTFNVHSFTILNEGIDIELEMYGTQEVIIQTNDFDFINVSSDNPDLIINNFTWNSDSQIIKINIKGKNMQGEIGTILILGSWHLSNESKVGSISKGI